MAIIKTTDLDGSKPPIQNPNASFNPSVEKAPEVPKPTLGETVGAAFSQENTIANLKNFVTTDRIKTDPNFNPYDNLEQLDQDHLDAYLYADSMDEINTINERIASENKAKDILNRSGAMGTVAVLGASIADPTILVPGAIGVKAGLIGRSVAGVASGAALGAGAVGAQEGILQGAQETRTTEESLTNIAFATALGGVLGGAVGSLSKGVTKGIAKGLEADTVHFNPTTGDSVINGENISAAKVDPETGKAREGIAWLNYKDMTEYLNALDKSDPQYASLKKKIKAQEEAFKFTSSVVPALRSPIIRGLTSIFETPRKLINELFEHTYVVGKNLQGEKLNPVETAIKQSHADMVKLNKDVHSLYLNYMGVSGLGKGTVSQVRAGIKSATTGKLSATKFKEEIAKQLRRDAPHEIKEVNDAAGIYRNHYVKQARKLQEQGLLTDIPEDKLATYLPRYYNVDKIIENRPIFRDKIMKYLREGVENPEYSKLGPTESAVKGIEKWIYKPITDEIDVELRANKIIDNIVGLGDESLAMSEVVNRTGTASAKQTKSRALLINDSEIEDFLHNDLDAITSIYTNKSTSLAEFQNMLSRNGWETANDIRKELRDQLEEAIRKNPGQEKKLTKKYKDDLDLVNDSISIIMGTINKGKNTLSGKALQHLRKYNVMRMLGGVLVSSIPDMMMPVFKHGLPRTIKDGWLGFARDFKKAKLTGDEAKDFGLALELEENLILKSLHEGDFRTGIENSRIARLGDDIVQGFGKITGLSYWNVLGKRIGARVSGARTMRAIKAGSKASPKEQARLAQLGIDKDLANRINEQFSKYGEEASGSYVSHFDTWTDEEAARAFAHSMVKEADATTITPGLGDIPAAIQKSELLRTVFQFRSFSAAATNRLLLTGMQQRDLNALMGMTMLAIMGSVTYMTKEKIAGREPDTDLDKLLLEGISRSGLAGLQGDYIMGLNPYTKSSRWASLSANGVLLGPSSTVLGDIYKLGVDPDLKSAKKMAPYGNLFYLNLLFDKSKEGNK